jgi:hypothetical protein
VYPAQKANNDAEKSPFVIAAWGVRREKAALSTGSKSHPTHQATAG